MALAAVKTWNPGDVLTAADLNALNTNILNNPITLVSPTTGAINFQTSVAHTNLAPSAVTASSGGVNASLIATSSGISIWSASPIQGQCRLNYVTSSGIRLSPYQGNLLPVKSSGGTWGLLSIPSTGVDLSSTTFTVATSMNYIYAFSSTGTLALTGQTSSFSHATSTENGVEIMTTDATRTLVGMIYTSTTAQNFSTAGVGNLVASWFNPRFLSSQSSLSANGNVATTNYSEFSSTLRVPFLVWSSDTVNAFVNGGIFDSSVVTIIGVVTLGFDGTTPEDCQIAFASTANLGDPTTLAIAYSKSGLAEGFHYATVLGGNSTGPLTLSGGAAPTNATPTPRTTLTVSVKV